MKKKIEEKKSKLFSNENFRILFSNAEKLHLLHVVILEELKYFFAISPSTVPVGLILSNKVKVFKRYAQYILDLSKSKNKLRELKEDKKFNTFLEECKKNDNTGKTKLF